MATDKKPAEDDADAKSGYGSFDSQVQRLKRQRKEAGVTLTTFDFKTITVPPSEIVRNCRAYLRLV